MDSTPKDAMDWNDTVLESATSEAILRIRMEGVINIVKTEISDLLKATVGSVVILRYGDSGKFTVTRASGKTAGPGDNDRAITKIPIKPAIEHDGDLFLDGWISMKSDKVCITKAIYDNKLDKIEKDGKTTYEVTMNVATPISEIVGMIKTIALDGVFTIRKADGSGLNVNKNSTVDFTHTFIQ